MMFAPQAANQDYFDIAKLSEVGGVKEDLSQQGINEAMQRFQFENMAPYEQLGLYNQLIQGTYGGTTTGTSTAPRRSLGSGMLGGAAAGAGVGFLGNQALDLGFNNSEAALYGGLTGGLLGGLS